MVAPESGKTKTPWLETERTQFPQLTENRDCDVLVIGAGVAGLVCAYMFAKAGKKVVVVDSGKIRSGESQRTTAHLCDQIDDGYAEIEKLYGAEKSKLVKESLTASVSLIEKIVIDEKIDCDFSRVDGYLYRYPNDKYDLTAERDAGLRAGFENIEYCSSLDAVAGSADCLRYPNQAQIHLVKFLNGLCKALTEMNVQIFQESRVEKINNKGPKKERPEALFVNHMIVSAADIVVATNGPIIDFSIQTKIIAYRTFAVAIKIPVGSIRTGLYWDTEDPYHYVRMQPIDGSESEELLIVGGEDHRVGEFDDAELRFQRLIEFANKKFGAVGEVAYKWSGQVYEPTDALGFIGEDPELGKHIYVVTGDSGMGVTNAAVAGILLTDLIFDKQNAWEKVYSLSRKPLKALGEYISENAHSLSHYKDNLDSSKVVPLDTIVPGQGGIVESDGKKVAAYKSEDGALNKVSPYCTHLKGLLCWNSCESSWDCPVHGSRFMATGEVIYGPADGNLEKIE